MTRQHTPSMHLLNSLCIAGLSMSFMLTAVSPAQAGILDRIRGIFRPSSQLGSASGTSRGGGSRNICQAPTADTIGASAVLIAAEDDVTTIELNETSLPSLVAFVPSIVEEHPEFGKREVLVEGKTLEAYPRFSIYVPFSKADDQMEDGAILKFSISDKEKSEYVAGPFDLDLPEKPGFVIIQMTDALAGSAQIEESQSEEFQFTGLKPDILYEWTVTLHCDTKASSGSLQSVSGLISLDSDSELSSSELTDYDAYLKKAIWYEVVAQLIANKDEDPAQWSEFLSLYDDLQDDIADQDVISIVVPTMATTNCAN